jgi:hypothetical protein
MSFCEPSSAWPKLYDHYDLGISSMGMAWEMVERIDGKQHSAKPQRAHASYYPLRDPR